ncbi:MAG: dihydropteroate synthase [Candidatus Woesearchaeota archaeon]|jgi:dihydropteroate synthase|nr:dihydropteroate synthase [Candidatus Woesearchaeota archaeon]MDP7323786.1 dihydropteroate synthase [Candidatus Woesearchaeota archaeon]MDP7457306.1 dihydropteroate synthase [Candidatus Woesearchaeota archaeon]|tara:strand:- start:139 stop:954 length:816 start_codon:yes stop_codon:yes gene_type:complete
MIIGDYEFDFKETHVVGVLNVTPDSFSDGGNFFSAKKAIARAKQMIKQGATIIDLGGESTKPGSDSISEKEELNRVLPVIKALFGKISVPISIDSCKPGVVAKCLEAGASLVNDVTGLRDTKMVDVVAKHNVPVIIMHMQGNPRDMQKNPSYKDVVEDIVDFFTDRIKTAEKKGIHDIILDPGIGFGKTVEHNLQILNRLGEFCRLERPIMVGSSRKSFIGKLTGAEVDKRLPGTIASVAISIMHGADLVRVHDVEECRQAAMITDAIKNA